MMNRHIPYGDGTSDPVRQVTLVCNRLESKTAYPRRGIIVLTLWARHDKALDSPVGGICHWPAPGPSYFRPGAGTHRRIKKMYGRIYEGDMVQSLCRSRGDARKFPARVRYKSTQRQQLIDAPVATCTH